MIVSDRETFDRIMMGGSLGTPATPYEEWLKMKMQKSYLWKNVLKTGSGW